MNTSGKPDTHKGYSQGWLKRPDTHKGRHYILTRDVQHVVAPLVGVRHRAYRWLPGLLVTIVVIVASGAFYCWYSASDNDSAPDSIVGLSFAVMGTVCVLLAAVLYTACRRSRKKRIGQLNIALHWHVYLALMGFALLLMHSFGNFNARTGTYALYGLVAVVVSGVVGRAVDRIMPRLIAAEVAKTLTAQGEDRVEVLSRRLRTIAGQQARSAPQTSYPVYAQSIASPGMSWDIAYTSLETRQTHGPRRQFMPPSSLTFGEPYPFADIEEEMAVIEEAEQAIRREELYRSFIHCWRMLHIAIVLLALALIAWHLVFAAQLLLMK